MKNSSDCCVENIEALSLDELHAMLRKLERESSSKAQEIIFIKELIRNLLPKVDTGGAPPHRKTPSGRTKVLHINYTCGQTNRSAGTEIKYLRFFAQVTRELGLRLEILTHKLDRTEVEQELIKDEYEAVKYTILESQNPVSKWAEDSVEYLDNGDIAILSHLNDQLLIWAMTEGRRHRWQGMIDPEYLEAALREDHLWILMGTRVNALKTGAEREYAAKTGGQGVGHIRAYIEGGNMIMGEDKAGQPVLLVGKDAIGATAFLYQLNDNEVRQLICEDFGLEFAHQVICVEQPGQFHLDMGLLFIGQGVVIVNNSSEALQDAMEMSEMAPCLTTKTMAAKMQLQYSLEEAATNDLRAAGIEVRREQLASDTLYNFFNGEFVECKDGFNYYLTNGGPQVQEEKFERLMTKDWKVVEGVIFSPLDIAQESLQERGGLGCRIKGGPYQ